MTSCRPGRGIRSISPLVALTNDPRISDSVSCFMLFQSYVAALWHRGDGERVESPPGSAALPAAAVPPAHRGALAVDLRLWHVARRDRLPGEGSRWRSDRPLVRGYGQRR